MRSPTRNGAQPWLGRSNASGSIREAPVKSARLRGRLIRHFLETGCGLPDATAHFVMLFNILHAEEALVLLQKAKRVLAPDGRLGVMHWVYDSTTPRGPSTDIRLRPEERVRLVESAGFRVGKLLDFPHYHYGFSARPA